MTSGDGNFGLGVQCGRFLKQGDYNFIYGISAGPDTAGDTLANYGVAVGYNSLYNCVDFDNPIGIGYRAGYLSQHLRPLMIGYNVRSDQNYHAVLGGEEYTKFSTGKLDFKTDVLPTTGQILVYDTDLFILGSNSNFTSDLLIGNFKIRRTAGSTPYFGINTTDIAFFTLPTSGIFRQTTSGIQQRERQTKRALVIPYILKSIPKEGYLRRGLSCPCGTMAAQQIHSPQAQLP